MIPRCFGRRVPRSGRRGPWTLLMRCALHLSLALWTFISPNAPTARHYQMIKTAKTALHLLCVEHVDRRTSALMAHHHQMIRRVGSALYLLGMECVDKRTTTKDPQSGLVGLSLQRSRTPSRNNRELRLWQRYSCHPRGGGSECRRKRPHSGRSSALGPGKHTRRRPSLMR